MIQENQVEKTNCYKKGEGEGMDWSISPMARVKVSRHLPKTLGFHMSVQPSYLYDIRPKHRHTQPRSQFTAE